MNTNLRLLLIVACFGIYGSGKSQSTYQLGLLPSINLNKQLKNNWKLNLKFESRQLLLEGAFGEPSSFQYEYALSDLALVFSRKLALGNTLSGGYMARFRNNKLFHRFIQQFALVRQFASFRLAHRIATDQTHAAGEGNEYRFRYRLSTEFPLNGQSADPGEFYLKINNEYLNALQEGIYDLEIRLIPFFGYQFTTTNKLELGLDYRLNSFISGAARNRLWININWFLSI